MCTPTMCCCFFTALIAVLILLGAVKFSFASTEYSVKVINNVLYGRVGNLRQIRMGLTTRRTLSLQPIRDIIAIQDYLHHWLETTCQIEPLPERGSGPVSREFIGESNGFRLLEKSGLMNLKEAAEACKAAGRKLPEPLDRYEVLQLKSAVSVLYDELKRYGYIVIPNPGTFIGQKHDYYKGWIGLDKKSTPFQRLYGRDDPIFRTDGSSTRGKWGPVGLTSCVWATLVDTEGGSITCIKNRQWEPPRFYPICQSNEMTITAAIQRNVRNQTFAHVRAAADQKEFYQFLMVKDLCTNIAKRSKAIAQSQRKRFEDLWNTFKSQVFLQESQLPSRSDSGLPKSNLEVIMPKEVNETKLVPGTIHQRKKRFLGTAITGAVFTAFGAIHEILQEGRMASFKAEVIRNITNLAALIMRNSENISTLQLGQEMLFSNITAIYMEINQIQDDLEDTRASLNFVMSLMQVQAYLGLQQQKFETLFHDMGSVVSKLISHETPTALFTPSELDYFSRKVQDKYSMQLDASIDHIKSVVNPIQYSPGYQFEVFSLIHIIERPKVIYHALPIPIELKDGTIVVQQLSPTYFAIEEKHMFFRPLTPVDYALCKDKACRLDAMSGKIAADRCSAPYLMSQYVDTEQYVENCPQAQIIPANSYYFRAALSGIVFAVPRDSRSVTIRCPDYPEGRMISINRSGFLNIRGGCVAAFVGSGYYYSAPAAEDATLLERAYERVITRDKSGGSVNAQDVLKDIASSFGGFFNVVKGVPSQIDGITGTLQNVLLIIIIIVVLGGLSFCGVYIGLTFYKVRSRSKGRTFSVPLSQQLAGHLAPGDKDQSGQSMEEHSNEQAASVELNVSRRLKEGIRQSPINIPSVRHNVKSETVELGELSRIAQVGTDRRLRHFPQMDADSLEDISHFYPEQTSSTIGDEQRQIRPAFAQNRRTEAPPPAQEKANATLPLRDVTNLSQSQARRFRRHDAPEDQR